MARITQRFARLTHLFRRSLPIRVDEQRARIERTGLAGMI